MEGVSARRVDDLIKALGCDGISSSQVSRICEQLDEVVDVSWVGPWTAVVADGLTQTGRAASSTSASGGDGGQWPTGSVRSWAWTWERGRRVLAARRLEGSAEGLGGTGNLRCSLKNAIAAVFAGASWQRCRTHFMANLLTRVPKRAQPGVATMVRDGHLPATVSPCRGCRHGQLLDRGWNNSGPFAQVAELLADVGLGPIIAEPSPH